MQRHKIIILLLICIFVFSCRMQSPVKNSSYSNERPIIYEANTNVGIYPSPDESCIASLHIHEMGGFNVLTIIQTSNINDKFIVNDVSGIVWIGINELVYTTSPIYGKPGVFTFDCLKFKTYRLVSPRSFDKHYPDGTDFFELKRVIKDNKNIIQFYYSPDVRNTDFKRFRTNEYLYQVNMDGTGFKKVQIE